MLVLCLRRCRLCEWPRLVTQFCCAVGSFAGVERFVSSADHTTCSSVAFSGSSTKSSHNLFCSTYIRSIFFNLFVGSHGDVDVRGGQSDVPSGTGREGKSGVLNSANLPAHLFAIVVSQGRCSRCTFCGFTIRTIPPLLKKFFFLDFAVTSVCWIPPSPPPLAFTSHTIQHLTRVKLSGNLRHARVLPQDDFPS